MENNEVGWLISWLMECYERGILTKNETNGLEMTWGNVETTKEMLNMIAARQGFGDVLAEGVMRASQHVGGEASELAIYTKKGNTPRAHDHRTRWHELFDTCVSDTGTIERHLVEFGYPQFRQLGDPLEISTLTAKTTGAMPFEDSLGVCRFNSRMNLTLLSQAVSAVTGWKFTPEEAMTAGLRTANLMRAFNVRHGLTPELEYPSHRYGSTPVDGPAKGRSILPFWEQMLDNYYSLMGWDKLTGKPLPETLRRLGLEHIISHLW
jgi:aldehyde:ferredoxin oxidoreductase